LLRNLGKSHFSFLDLSVCLPMCLSLNNTVLLLRLEAQNMTIDTLVYDWCYCLIPSIVLDNKAYISGQFL